VLRHPGTLASQEEGGRGHEPLALRVGLIPVKGYRAAAIRVADVLERDLGLVPAGPSLLEEALPELRASIDDVRPAALPSLDAGTTSAEAIRGIFAEQLGAMDANLEGVCRDYDPEFLHDFRIAVRKARSLLGQVKALVPAEELDDFREGFAWLSRYTGPVRDLDVYILGFGGLQATIPRERQADLLPFRQVLLQERRERHYELVRVLRSPRYRTFVDRWRHFIEEIGGSGEPGWQRPVSELAGARIRRLYQRALREGDRLDGLSEDGQYHELRKTCKKLRYMMEFFQASFDDTVVPRLVKSLRRLQNRLGQYQDCSTQITTFRSFAEQMQASGRHSAGTIMALGVLTDRLEEKKLDHRHAFRACYEPFANGGSRAAVANLSPNGDTIEGPGQL
jgi:CHAD domain-containing protein